MRLHNSQRNASAPKPAERFDNIDLLRALAILSVILFHYTAKFDASFYSYQHKVPRFDYGYLGVQLFFIVSGFCIWMTASRSRGLVEFWVKRIGRIQPAYVVATILTFSVVGIFGLATREVDFPTMLANLIWLNAFFDIPYVDGIYWSLLVELKFYLLLGVIVFGLSRRANPLDVWCAVAVLWFGARLLDHYGWHQTTAPMFAVTSIFPHGHFFLIGMAAYEWNRLNWIRIATYGSVCAANTWFGAFDSTAKVILLMLLPAAVVVLRCSNLRIPTVLSFIGLISYPLYLVHQNIGCVVIQQTAGLIDSDYVRIALALATVVALATLLSVTVEHRLRPVFERLSLIPLQSASNFLEKLWPWQENPAIAENAAQKRVTIDIRR
jgi:peptidoglycan/LPS O-acetylase OafA/YrhL